MPVFDASSAITAWDNYPIEQFPPLWIWIEEQVATAEIKIAQVSFYEISHVSPDCAVWLSAAQVQTIPIGNEILRASLAIKQAMGIVNDQYHPKGADENDIICIATALVENMALVCDEARLDFPRNRRHLGG